MNRTEQVEGFFGQLADRLSTLDVKPVSSRLVWPLALLAAWGFDLLFWAKEPGLSFPSYVVVLVAFGYAIARSASTTIAPKAVLLLIPLVIFSFGSAMRAEPLTRVLDYLATILILGLLIDSLIEGRWLRYRLLDYISGTVHLVFALFALAGMDLSERRSRRVERNTPVKRYKAIIRGVLLALPLLIVFGLLFASADLIFSRVVGSPLRAFDGERVGEYAFRLFYVLVLAYVFTGMFLHAIRPATSRETSTKTSRASGLIGNVEGTIILGSLSAMFALFVGIQLRYLFGGSGALTDLGLTYAEYARRGFGELVTVAVFTLLLLIVLSFLVRRDSPRERRVFSLLSSGLVLLTGVILGSAFQRLLLYEDAFGFTRLRTYSHVFMVWLALTLIAVVVLQWRNSLRSITTVFLFVGLGYVVSLNLLSVDAFIANRNIDRGIRGAEFDVDYLSTLSHDAIPVMVNRVDELSGENKRMLSTFLICEGARMRNEKRPLQSIHVSRESARAALANYDRSRGKVGETECPWSTSY